MHLPFIKKVLGDVSLVPLMVGELNDDERYDYARVLLPLFLDPATVFVVSSDFCHWGKDFDYQQKFKDEPVLYKSIERLDRQAFDAIESHSVS
jgi:hypothetical protein